MDRPASIRSFPSCFEWPREEPQTQECTGASFVVVSLLSCFVPEGLSGLLCAVVFSGMHKAPTHVIPARWRALRQRPHAHHVERMQRRNCHRSFIDELRLGPECWKSARGLVGKSGLQIAAYHRAKCPTTWRFILVGYRLIVEGELLAETNVVFACETIRRCPRCIIARRSITSGLSGAMCALSVDGVSKDGDMFVVSVENSKLRSIASRWF